MPMNLKRKNKYTATNKQDPLEGERWRLAKNQYYSSKERNQYYSFTLWINRANLLDIYTHTSGVLDKISSLNKFV